VRTHCFPSSLYFSNIAGGIFVFCQPGLPAFRLNRSAMREPRSVGGRITALIASCFNWNRAASMRPQPSISQ